MKSKDPKSPSPFLQAAVALDNELTEFGRIAGSIEGLNIETDKGLDRSQQLLLQFDQCRQRIGSGMADLGRTLEESRELIEELTAKVSNRASEVLNRHKQVEHLLARFRTLGEMVGAVTASAGDLASSVKAAQADEDDQTASAEINDFNSRLEVLVAEANSLKEDAAKAKLKNLESSADSLRQKLQVTSNRLSHLTGGVSGMTAH